VRIQFGMTLDFIIYNILVVFGSPSAISTLMSPPKIPGALTFSKSELPLTKVTFRLRPLANRRDLSDTKEILREGETVGMGRWR